MKNKDWGILREKEKGGKKKWGGVEIRNLEGRPLSVEKVE